MDRVGAKTRSNALGVAVIAGLDIAMDCLFDANGDA
jgi:hypothetical protein